MVKTETGKRVSWISLIALTLLASSALASDVTLAWDESERAHGYRLTCGEITQDTGLDTTGTMEVAPGVHIFSVTAYNDVGESDPAHLVYLVRDILPSTVSADGKGHVVVSPTIGNVPCPNGLILQRSDDLKTWVNIASFPTPSSPLVIPDAIVPRCFYRLTIP